MIIKMKKTFLALTLAAVFGFCACNHNGKGEAADSINDSTIAQEMPMPKLSDTYDEWKLSKVGDVDVEFDATVTFNEDGSFAAGLCNSICGKFVQIDRRPDALRFEEVIRTQMMGAEPEMTIEDAFAQALDKVRSFHVCAGQMSLIDEECNEVIELVRL